MFHQNLGENIKNIITVMLPEIILYHHCKDIKMALNVEPK